MNSDNSGEIHGKIYDRDRKLINHNQFYRAAKSGRMNSTAKEGLIFRGNIELTIARGLLLRIDSEDP